MRDQRSIVHQGDGAACVKPQEDVLPKRQRIQRDERPRVIDPQMLPAAQNAFQFLDAPQESQ